MSSVAASVVAAIRAVAGNAPSIALHEPRFDGDEWKFVKECLDTGWVSSIGSYVDEFEGRLASACGVDHAVAVVNGTAALQLAVMLAGVRRGDEVIVPAMTFAATANAILHAGAVPYFADSEIATLGLDPDKLDRHLSEICEVTDDGLRNRATGRRIAAIIPVHVFGHPVDMDRLVDVAARYRLPVIEDAAEALGSSYKGRPAGSLSQIAAISFNGNKIVTTGGGGALLTNDQALAKRARHVATQAKRAHRWEFFHDEAGFNFRMPNINAALGVAQLAQLEGFVGAKRRLAESYTQAFDGMAHVTVFREPSFARSNYWLNTLILNNCEDREPVLAATNDAGIMTRPVWTLLHKLPMFKDCPRMDLSTAEDLERRVVNIPSSAVLACV
jgi:perosamine synthetase